jgi:hypothetical protein
MPFLASFTIQIERIEGVRPITAYTLLASRCTIAHTMSTPART